MLLVQVVKIVSYVLNRLNGLNVLNAIDLHPPYKNSGSHNVMPGQMYMQARHMQTMTM